MVSSVIAGVDVDPLLLRRSRRLLAALEVDRSGARILIRSEALARTYDTDRSALDAVLRGLDEGERARRLRLLVRARLVDSRTRFVRDLLAALAAEQTAYVSTGNRLDLQELSQRDLARTLGAGAARRPDADPSRVCRVLGSATVLVADDHEVELASLCPSLRDVHREHVRDLLRREQARMVAGEIEGRLTDTRIAAEISGQCACPVSRRTVAYIREELGIPNHRERARRGCYLTVTAGFGALLPCTSAAIADRVPAKPGVYEIRLSSGVVEYPTGACSIIYVGSSNRLRKRLLDQVRGDGHNPLLASHLATGRVQVRYTVLRREWREFERLVYDQFGATFGAPPACNRMSP